jgi:hypothetical protein
VTLDGFFRWTEPVDDEWLVEDRAKVNAEWLASVQLSVALPHDLQLLAGYQHERTDLDVDPAWVGTYRDTHRDIELVELSYELEGVSLSLSQQWIWEEDPRRDLGSGDAGITSFYARVLF